MGRQFDVFLSYNSLDQAPVEEIGVWLRGQKLLVWLDKWELRPGFPWQEGLEAAVRTSQAVAVFVGANGLGPWTKSEVQAFNIRSKHEPVPIIPVLLPGCPDLSQLDLSLKALTWVDLRKGVNEKGLVPLLWGITGRKREDTENEAPASSADSNLADRVEGIRIPQPRSARSHSSNGASAKRTWIVAIAFLILVASFVFFRAVIGPKGLDLPNHDANLTVSGIHADCSQGGFCAIELEIGNKGHSSQKVTAFKYQVLAYRSFATLGGMQAPDLLGDLDLSDQEAPSKAVRYAHRMAPDVIEGGEARSLILKVTARNLSKGFGLWTIRPVLETSAGDLPLSDIQLMLPHWDARLLSHEG